MNLASNWQPGDLITYFGGWAYPASLVTVEGAILWLVRVDDIKRLAIVAEPQHPILAEFEGERQAFEGDLTLCLCHTTPENAKALRARLPGLQPAPLGLATSAGFGDRLGLATPGHVRALRRVASADGQVSIAPIFAQQSMRENARTGRTPAQVLDEATWGAFEAGWRGPVGADADHLKTPDDIEVCAAAGYSLFTFDPGAYVEAGADSADAAEIERRFAALPWADLEDTASDLRRRYTGQTIDLGTRALTLTEAAGLRAAVKYGRAVAHAARMYRQLQAKGLPFEVEVSVDETETPTTHAEHCYIAQELRRLGVRFVSLAPRYVGRFEKGVDYIGDLDELRADLAGHAAIAQALGPYKLSLHSGSDKFSVYSLIVEATGGQVHLKTAGTSYLEALRAIARVAPLLFREVVALALERYAADRATYHVSAEASRVPGLATVSDTVLPGLLDQFDAREVLHVTFGSILGRYGADIRAKLIEHEPEHYLALEQRFVRHLEPFAR